MTWEARERGGGEVNRALALSDLRGLEAAASVEEEAREPLEVRKRVVAGSW